MFVGKENKISADKLRAGETIIIVGVGESMTPILRSGQPVIVAPVTAETVLKKNDVVFCKVGGNYYLHKVTAIRNGKTFQISNNHGHSNSWCSRNCIFGIMIKKIIAEKIFPQKNFFVF